MFEQYRRLCEDGKLQIGVLWLYKTPNKWVLNFPTKRHWREPSQVEYIERGLAKFAASYSQMGIHSIAFPPLGCGNGQLDFKTQVQPLMEKYLRNLPIEVFIYPERKSQFVEHLDQKEMEHWLRSEPESLPFSEVWNDLRQLLSNKSQYETLKRGKVFAARMIEEPAAVEIVASDNKPYTIAYDTLVSFWQQLRTHGFSMRHIAPSLDRDISYIIPIFRELDYVAPVVVADQFDKLQSAATIGLQVLPSAFSSRAQTAPSVEQLSFL